MKQTLKERWEMNSKIKIQDKNGSLVKFVSFSLEKIKQN